MDRTIDPALRRRLRIRRLIAPSGLTVAAVSLWVLVTSWLHPSVRRDQIRTARVERGDVSATLDASGLVVPGFEQILTAPVSTRVSRILKTPGAEARPGEPIVLLDDKDENPIESAYGSGRGRVTVQAKAHVEEMERGKNRIIVTELPYMVNKSSLIERIADLAREGYLEGLSDLRDESDRQGMRIVLEMPL